MDETHERTPEPVQTQDGSWTLRQRDTGWTYRSVRGAQSESRDVFVHGSAVPLRGGPRVLEFGFGAGTNFAATFAAVVASTRTGDRVLHYEAIERDPVSPALLPCFGEPVDSLARRATAEGHAEDGRVRLDVHRTSFDAFAAAPIYDAVYFDPFGPTDQPESWSVEIFLVAAAALAPGARLVTYSAAGWIRRNMAAAGLFVATTPGPAGGKREFTIAARDPAALGGAKVRNAPAHASD